MTENPEIPREAVEAAAEAYIAMRREDYTPPYQLAVAMLTAAAPHMRSPREKRFDIPTDPDDGLLEWTLGDPK